MRKLVEARVTEEEPARVLEALARPGELVSSLPYVVGLRRGRVRLLFRRLLVRFQDDYKLASEKSDGSVRLVFEGERSRIVLEYRVEDGRIVAYGEYRGPRGWVVWPRLRELAEAALEEARRQAARGAGGPSLAGEDYSGLLADLSWVTRLLSKSMLVKTMDVILQRGGFHEFVEELHESGVLREYRVVYVSGTGLGSFRLLFVNGELAGVYVALGGEEFVGDPRALNRLEGLYRVKVYGSLAPLERVVSIG